MTDGHITLDELLNDPLVRLVMERDNVRPDELRRSLERARGASKLSPPPRVMVRTCAGELCAC
jgi:hypothetical protein